MPIKTAALLTRLNAIGFALFAFFWIGAAFPGLDGPARGLIDLLDWPLGDGPAEFDRYTRWLSSIGAGLTAALAVMTYMIVAPALERGDESVRKGAIAAILVWLVVDSAGSVGSGVGSNAVFNALFAALYLAPLLLARRG